MWTIKKLENETCKEGVQPFCLVDPKGNLVFRYHCFHHGWGWPEKTAQALADQKNNGGITT